MWATLVIRRATPGACDRAASACPARAMCFNLLISCAFEKITLRWAMTARRQGWGKCGQDRLFRPPLEPLLCSRWPRYPVARRLLVMRQPCVRQFRMRRPSHGLISLYSVWRAIVSKSSATSSYRCRHRLRAKIRSNYGTDPRHQLIRPKNWYPRLSTSHLRRSLMMTRPPKKWHCESGTMLALLPRASRRYLSRARSTRSRKTALLSALCPVLLNGSCLQSPSVTFSKARSRYRGRYRQCSVWNLPFRKMWGGRRPICEASSREFFPSITSLEM